MAPSTDHRAAAAVRVCTPSFSKMFLEVLAHGERREMEHRCDLVVRLPGGTRRVVDYDEDVSFAPRIFVQRPSTFFSTFSRDSSNDASPNEP